MDFEEIRRQTIIALFSDDVLFDQIVLKGGNALGILTIWIKSEIGFITL